MTVVDIPTHETVVCRPSDNTKPAFVLQDLDTRDSATLKALAITAIVLHNFFHLVSRARQNEFAFDPTRFTAFLQTVQHPGFALQAVFSFFGHYGVQIFVFLSAYGLAKAHWDPQESWAAFMWGRIRKLYPTFVVVVLGWACGDALLMGPILFVKQMGLHVVLMLLGVSTLVGFGMPPIGPWWFIPFIIQFYAIWPLLRKLTHRFGWRALLALSVLSLLTTYFANPLLKHWSLNLLYTPAGRLPVLCMGIAAARYPLRLRGSVVALAFALLVLGNRYQPLWLLTAPSVVLVAMWMYIRLRDTLRNFGWLQRLGAWSMLVFLLNAIIRNLINVSVLRFCSPWSYVHSPGLQLLCGCISAVLTFAIAAAVHESLRSPARGPSEAMHKEMPTVRHAPPMPVHSVVRGSISGIRKAEPLPVQQ